ncbi:hypothetical protein D3C73_1601150 [compost metagenome]
MAMNAARVTPARTQEIGRMSKDLRILPLPAWLCQPLPQNDGREGHDDQQHGQRCTERPVIGKAELREDQAAQREPIRPTY